MITLCDIMTLWNCAWANDIRQGLKISEGDWLPISVSCDDVWLDGVNDLRHKAIATSASSHKPAYFRHIFDALCGLQSSNDA